MVHHVSPIGIAAAAGTCLIVDLDPTVPSYRSEQTVAGLLEDGVRRSDLIPNRSGTAVLGNGGIEPEAAMGVVEVLAEGWPAVVLRVGKVPLDGIRSLSVIPLLPETVLPDPRGPRVYQALDREFGGVRGVVIPPLSRTRLRGILDGRLDPRWSWVQAWRSVWEGRPWA